MASLPSEPEKYSIDEMMERLKNRPSSGDEGPDGELVTREDGTQAIKVRRRKRRSHQPHKAKEAVGKRSRAIQLSAVLLLLLVALLLCGAAIIYSNSSPFRKSLEAKIRADSGAKVEMQQFRMNPTSARANRVTLDWPEGNALASFDLRTVNARVFPASFFGTKFTGEEITAGEGLLTLRSPAPDAAVREQPSAADESGIRFKRYAVNKLDVSLGDPAAPLVTLRRSEGSLYPDSVNGRPQILLSRGDLTIPGIPPFRLDRAQIEFRGSQTDVIGMRLKNPDDNRGVLEVAGTVSPYAAETGSTLAVRLDSFLVSSLAGPDLGHIISGRIDSLPSADSNYLTFQTRTDLDAALAVEFRNASTGPLVLQGLPFLTALHHLLDDPWFETPKFEDDARGVIRRANGNVTIGNLEFIGKGRIAIRGDISMTANRALSGELRVGVADAMVLSARNPRLDAMFGPEQEGFRWINLKLSGSAPAPVDDFRAIYEAANQAADSPETLPDGAVPSFEDLTRPDR